MALPPQRSASPGAAPRVLHILGELRPSGAEVMLRIAAPLWFAGAGCHAILATGEAEGPYAGSLRAAGFEVFHIPFHKRLGFFRKVYALIRDGRFYAVHIHTERAHVYYGLVARCAGVRRIIRTVHSTFPFTGWLRLVRMAMRFGLRLLGATMVAVGPSVADNELRRFRNRVAVIPNWCDYEQFRPPSPAERAASRRALGIAGSWRILTTVGNCSAVKNHPVVFRSIEQLLKTSPHWCYVHAGGEDAQSTERALAAEAGVLGHCIFLGYTPAPRDVLWATDVFVMPSLREGFSIAAIEAAACGLPLVLSDVPGLRDLKATVPDGFWVRPEPAAIAEAIEAACLRSPSGSAGNAASVRAMFGVESGAKAYYDLYAGISPAETAARPGHGAVAVGGAHRRDVVTVPEENVLANARQEHLT